MVTGLFLAAAQAVAPLLRAPELAARWTEPSALTAMRTSGLAGHTARAVLNVETWLDADVAPDAVPVDAVEYFVTVGGPDIDDPDTTVNRMVRERAEQTAVGGPHALADAYDAARARLATRLPGLRGDAPVALFGRSVLTLDDCLVTRLIELAVHADDLAVTLGLPTPDVGEPAAALVITTLAGISRRRHGPLPVIRALARRERAPSTIAAF